MANSGTFTFTGSTNDIQHDSVTDIPFNVTGLSGPVTGVTVELDHFTASEILGLSFLLVAPDGTSNLVFMSDSGNGYSLTDQTLYFADPGVGHSLTFPIVQPFDDGGAGDF